MGVASNEASWVQVNTKIVAKVIDGGICGDPISRFDCHMIFYFYMPNLVLRSLNYTTPLSQMAMGQYGLGKT